MVGRNRVGLAISLLALLLAGVAGVSIWFFEVPGADGLTPHDRWLLSIDRWPELKIGMTQSRVRRIVGNPTSVELAHSGNVRLDKWYYGPGTELDFKNGRLAAVYRF